MIDLFLLAVTIANCILFGIMIDCFKAIEQFYDVTNSYLKNIQDSYDNIQNIYEHTEEVYKIITEQYEEVAKLMGWRDENEETL